MMTGKQLLMSQYRKALREVTKRIGKLESEGYIIPERMKPKEKKLKSPSDIRKEIERLKKYKESYIKRRRGVKYKTREGKIVKGEIGEEKQRSERAKKGWRERREREKKEKISLGDALYDSIMAEVDEGIRQLPYINDIVRKEGYTRRCFLVRDTLISHYNEDAEAFSRYLAEVNETTAVERAQLACRYDVGAPETEAWLACIALLQTLNKQTYTAEQLQEFEDIDAEEAFESFYD